MKPKIREVIVVEGRDDTCAVKRAVDAVTIETHGFGISQRTWKNLETAYKEKGIIVFTDPDFAGNNIRKRVLERFPKAKEAFLSRNKATKKNDIGIENASPEAILEALQKVQFTLEETEDVFNMDLMAELGLWGFDDSKYLREQLGDKLGIGYGNAKAFMKKLNKYGITVEQLKERIDEIGR